MKRLLLILLILLVPAGAICQTTTHLLNIQGRATVDPREFYAPTDGITDASTEIQAAVDSLAPSGGTLTIDRTYLITTPITLASNISIVGANGKAKIIADGCSAFLIDKESSTNYSGITTAAEALVGATTISLSSVSGVAEGDTFWVNNVPYATGYVPDGEVVNEEGFEGYCPRSYLVVGITGSDIEITPPVSMRIAAGQTVEKTVPSKALRISGLSIVSDGSDTVVKVSKASNLIIENCSIDCGGAMGVQVMYGDRVIIKNSTITNFGNKAIFIRSGSHNCIVENNSISGATVSSDGAITLFLGANNNLIVGNKISGTTEITEGSGGVYIGYHSYLNQVVSNTVTGYDYGITSHFGAHNNVISNNSISACNTGIYLISSNNMSVTSNTITDTTGATDYHGAIQIKNVRDSIIDANVITRAVKGIHRNFAQDTRNIIISNNTISEVDRGITFLEAKISGIIIQGNSIRFRVRGISNYPSIANLSITNNILEGSGLTSEYGLYLVGTPYAHISGNKISTVANGVYIGANTILSSVTENNISNVGEYGILIYPGTSGLLYTSGNVIASYGVDIASNTFSTVPDLPTTNVPAGFVVTAGLTEAELSTTSTVFGWRKKTNGTSASSTWVIINKSETSVP